MIDFPTGPVTRDKVGGGKAQGSLVIEETDLAKEARNLVLSEFSPATVIVDQMGEVQYIHGHTGRFLEPAAGRASHKISAMAREGLRLELAAALRKARNSGQVVRSSGIKVKVNGGSQYIDLTVKPLETPTAMRGLLAVVFEEVKEPPSVSQGKAERKSDADLAERLADLEQELQHTRERHQGAIEELETSNEELKSINEELQSANEELQSTNEELEATKEEQQSLNEELATVNTELQAKIDELAQSQDDLKNLLASTEIATLFLGNDLTVKRFTPETAKLINLIATDVGRPVRHLVTNLAYNDLVADVGRVIQSLKAEEKEVRTKDGVWYLMRIIPYRTMENFIDGAVITFSNIDKQKRTQEALSLLNKALKESGENLETLLETRDGELEKALAELSETSGGKDR